MTDSKETQRTGFFGIPNPVGALLGKPKPKPKPELDEPASAEPVQMLTSPALQPEQEKSKSDEDRKKGLPASGDSDDEDSIVHNLDASTKVTKFFDSLAENDLSDIIQQSSAEGEVKSTVQHLIKRIVVGLAQKPGFQTSVCDSPRSSTPPVSEASMASAELAPVSVSKPDSLDVEPAPEKDAQKAQMPPTSDAQMPPALLAVPTPPNAAPSSNSEYWDDRNSTNYWIDNKTIFFFANVSAYSNYLKVQQAAGEKDLREAKEGYQIANERRALRNIDTKAIASERYETYKAMSERSRSTAKQAFESLMLEMLLTHSPQHLQQLYREYYLVNVPERKKSTVKVPIEKMWGSSDMFYGMGLVYVTPPTRESEKQVELYGGVFTPTAVEMYDEEVNQEDADAQIYPVTGHEAFAVTPGYVTGMINRIVTYEQQGLIEPSRINWDILIPRVVEASRKQRAASRHMVLPTGAHVQPPNIPGSQPILEILPSAVAPVQPSMQAANFHPEPPPKVEPILPPFDVRRAAHTRQEDETVHPEPAGKHVLKLVTNSSKPQRNLREMSNLLKQALRLSGNSTIQQVVAYAVEQLDITTEGKTIEDLAREACEALGI